MGDLTLPFKGSLATGAKVFEIDCPGGDGGTAIFGGADAGTGVQGSSKGFDAIVGQTSSDAHAGVTGRNLTTGANGGVGLYGTGGLYAGKFDGNVVVNGDANSDALNSTSASPQHAGVSANNSASGFGLWAASDGVAIFGRGGNLAGQFQGNVVVTGNASADALNSTSASPQHAGVSANNTAGGFGLWASSNGTGIFGRGTPAGYFDGDVQVTGDLVLINSPSSGDVAEDFDLEDDPLHAEPGTVLIIGPNGRLSASLEMYDTRVAGVVSGAGELKPAVVLQRINVNRRRSPIALIGKVFCKADAAFGSICAGDLLTTSATPGHAMKVNDRPKALGAILGKALAPLGNGRGLIPILVSLR